MVSKVANKTVDMKKLMSIPIQNRAQLAATPITSDIFGNLTPSEIAKLFPKYYQEKLPDIQNFLKASSDPRVRFGHKGESYGGSTYTGAPDGGTGGSRSGGKSGSGAGYIPPPAPSKIERLYSGLGMEMPLGKGAKVPGTGNLEPGSKAELQKMIYDGYIKAGFSHKQSIALTAEAGRENSYNPQFIFGTHTDPANGATNLGILSFQKGRKTALLAHLQNEGRIDENGQIIRDQETINSMARFTMNEMKGPENGPMVQEFLANPDIDSERSAELLGRGYIRWRYDDPAYAHHKDIRRRHYEDVVNTVSGFEDAESSEPVTPEDTLPDNPETGETVTGKPAPFVSDPGKLTPETQEFLNSLSPEEAAMFWKAVEKKGYDEVNKVAGGLTSNEHKIGELETAVRVEQRQDELAGIRKLPLQDDLVNTMTYAAQKISEDTGRNIKLRTFSGGQAPYGSSGPRTGSTEHDLGGAADNYFIEVMPDGTERRLSMANPEDKQLMYQTAYHFVRAGGRSVGLEPGYMGEESIHFGISRNNPDPTHHADDELSAIVDQARNEFVAEAKEKGWDPISGYKEFYQQELEMRKARQKEIEAATQPIKPPEVPGPVPDATSPLPPSATQSDVPEPPTATPVPDTAEPVPAVPVEAPQGNPTPQFATGGDVPKEENLSIVNRHTGEPLAHINKDEKVSTGDDGRLHVESEMKVKADQSLAKTEVPSPVEYTPNSVEQAQAEKAPEQKSYEPMIGSMRGSTTTNGVQSEEVRYAMADGVFEHSPSVARAMHRAANGDSLKRGTRGFA